MGGFGDERGAGFFEAGAVGWGVGGDEGEVEDERVLRWKISHRGGGIRVEFDDVATGGIGEKGRVGCRGLLAGDGEADVGDIPSGVGAGVGDVEGKVFEFHGKGNAERGGRSAGVNAAQ